MGGGKSGHGAVRRVVSMAARSAEVPLRGTRVCVAAELSCCVRAGRCVSTGVRTRANGARHRLPLSFLFFFFYYSFFFLPPSPPPPPLSLSFFPPHLPPIFIIYLFLNGTHPAGFKHGTGSLSVFRPSSVRCRRPPAPGQPHAAAAPRCPARRSRSRARSRGPSSGRALGMSAGNERSVKAPLIRVMNPKEPAAAELTPPREEGGNNRGSN